MSDSIPSRTVATVPIVLGARATDFTHPEVPSSTRGVRAPDCLMPTVATVRDGNGARSCPDVSKGGSDAFARAVLNAATEAEAAERVLKESILTAARAGNSALIERVVARWLIEPASEVLKSGLD